MEGEVVLENKGNRNGVIMISCNGNESVREFTNAEKKAENLENEILENLDSYMDDINNRLIISRMVNDSVIKGLVNAVEQEAACKIAAKELEVMQLKELLRLNDNQVESLGFSVNSKESRDMRLDLVLNNIEAGLEYEKMRETVERLKNEASEHITKVGKELYAVRGCNSLNRISSGSELVGLGGILHEKESESWVRVDEQLDGLKETINTMFTLVNDILQMSSISFREWQHEQEIREDIEAMVTQSSIRSLQDESEKLLDQNSNFCDSTSVYWQENLDKLSGLREELDSMLKLFSNPESGQMISNGLHDLDNFHSKCHGNHVTSPVSLWQGNGKMEDSKIDMPENFDAAQLKHMSREELVSYINGTIRKMRRDHESIVAKMTDEYFRLRREYLKIKEWDPSLPHRRDHKEIDIVRKKIPDVIMKLDKILIENENVASSSESKSLSNLKDRLDCLLSENRRLTDLLTDKENEVKCLSSQISDAAEKMLQQSLVEANMMKVIDNLYSTIEDTRIEAAIIGMTHRCFLEELSGQIRCETEESNMEFVTSKEIYDIMLREIESHDNCDVEDSYIEALIMQEICGLIFRETIKDAQQKHLELYSKYLHENERSTSHEKKALEKESRLWLIIEERERLGQQVLALESSLQEKQTSVEDLSAALSKEKELVDMVSEELSSLRKEATRQQIIASECSKELEAVKNNLLEALQQIEEDKVENCRLHQMLEQKSEELKKINEQREALLALSEERYTNLMLAEGKEEELKKQMKAIVLNVHVLSKLLGEFESKVEDAFKTNSSRLEDSCSHLASLSKKADSLRRSGLMYKEQYERKCADLQMAETEVDLLGDEVDGLLGLLEKIYIALDHYSPVLKHYPGVMETLQLVRRNLSRELTKSA